MPTPGDKTKSAVNSVPKQSSTAKQETVVVPPKKRKSKWVLILLVLLLIGLAASYWRPLMKLPATLLHKSADSAASAPPAGQSTGSAAPSAQSTAVTAKPTPAATGNSSAAATAAAASGSKTSTSVSEAAEIAKSYAAMSPAKAAAVLQTQTSEEVVYAMAEMSSIERAHIWSKMDPGKVADIAYQLKRHSEWTEEEIAQLRQKVYSIKQQELLNTPSRSLALTYAQMPPAAAAKLIDQMLQTDSTHTLPVVGNMENTARTRILTMMIEDPALMDSAISITNSLQK